MATMQAIRHADTRDMTREEWVEARRSGVGGSDISVIAGVNPWRSPMQLYLEKTGELPDQEPNAAMEWGIKLEDLVASHFAEQDPSRKVLRVNAILQHPEYTWALANVDRRVIVRGGEPGILEVKTTSEYLWDDWADGKAPLYAQAQLQWYLGVTGYSRGWLAVLIGGRTYVEVEIQRDEQVIEHLFQLAGEFWQCVETRTPPAWDGSEASTQLLAQTYPEAKEGEQVLLPLEAEDLIRERQLAKAEEDAAKKRKLAAENKLKGMLGKAETGLIQGEPVVRWPTVERAGYTVKPTTYRKFEVIGG